MRLLLATALPIFTNLAFSVEPTSVESSTKDSTEAVTSKQQDLEEVVVTGDLRERSLMEIGSNVSVINKEQLNSRESSHLESLLSSVANVNYSTGASRGRFFQIRGIGERSQFVEPVNPSVGLIVDDMDFSNMGLSAGLFDVSQVEVFRGPQGTRAGANGLAGLIKIDTADFEQPGYAQYRLASFNTQELGLATSADINESARFRFSINKLESDGFMENDFLDRKDTHDKDELIGRVKSEFAIHDRHSMAVNLYHIDINNGYDAFTLDNSFKTLSDEPGFDQQDTQAGTLKLTSDFDSILMETIISQSNSDLAYGYDEDWTNTSFLGLGGYSSTDHYFRDRKQSTQEIRATYVGESLIPFVTGIYHSVQSENLERVYTYAAGPFNSEFETEHFAWYGELDYEISNTTQVNTGARFEQRKSDYVDSENASFKPVDNMTGGHISILHSLSENEMLYATLSRGYKAGGFNTDGTLPDGLKEYNPEYLQGVEFGYKGQIENLFLSASAFLLSRSNQQIKTWLTRPVDPDFPNGATEFVAYRSNAADGRNYGIEISGDLQVNERLQVFFNVGQLESTYGNYDVVEVQSDYSEVVKAYDNRQQAHAPRYQGNLGTQYQSGSFTARLELDGKDEFYFSDTHPEQSTGYVLAHGKLTKTFANFEMSLYGRNLFNRQYTTRGFGGFGNDPRNGYALGRYVQFGEPRTIGFAIKYTFN